MSIFNAKIGVHRNSNNPQCCTAKNGCPAGVCPDFTIRRHDTKPNLEFEIEDDVDLSSDSLLIEVNMWSKGKLKKDLAVDDDCFKLAGNIGFNQILNNDIVVVEQARRPEYMLVTGFDEVNKEIRVQRGYRSTPVTALKKGTTLRFFRVADSEASIQIVKDSILQVDGTTLDDQVISKKFVYEWGENDTCVPGCFWLEFKLMKLNVEVLSSGSFTPSTLSASDFGCGMGAGIEWIRRFPTTGEGLLIKVEDSFTAENIGET